MSNIQNSVIAQKKKDKKSGSQKAIPDSLRLAAKFRASFKVLKLVGSFYKQPTS